MRVGRIFGFMLFVCSLFTQSICADISFKERTTKKIQSFFDNKKGWFENMNYCDPRDESSGCEEKEKVWNYYTGILGGPFLFINDSSIMYLGSTIDFPLGIYTRSGMKTKAFELKFFNQFFLVDSTKVGSPESFDIDANLHGVQFRYITGRILEKNNKIKPYKFIGLDLGYARMSGNSAKNGIISIDAPTFGGAVGVGIDYAVSKSCDIGFEVPIGFTALVADIGVVVFPDIFPNVSLKFNF